MKKIYVIHENEEWVLPLRDAFTELNLPYEEWFIDSGLVDMNSTPPEGVFYNRMSASSHTRDHRYAVELTEPLLSWLELYGKRVINNRKAMQLEVRKFEQCLALKQFGIKVPKTIAANGIKETLEAAKQLGESRFILKPNRGGKGSGVQLINDFDNLEDILNNQNGQRSLDGIFLVQEYIKPQDTHITRVEFVDGKFYYAVRVDTSEGFELCPADACEVGDDFCPTDATEGGTKPKFEIIENYENPDIEKYEKFLAANGMEVAAIEYAVGEDGERYVYDVNINTNYNSQAEERNTQGLRGMKRIAEFLGEELDKL